MSVEMIIFNSLHAFVAIVSFCSVVLTGMVGGMKLTDKPIEKGDLTPKLRTPIEIVGCGAIWFGIICVVAYVGFAIFSVMPEEKFWEK